MGERTKKKREKVELWVRKKRRVDIRDKEGNKEVEEGSMREKEKEKGRHEGQVKKKMKGRGGDKAKKEKQ